MTILTLDGYKSAWRKQNPHDRVKPPKTIKPPYIKLAAIMVGVVAVNILSMAHTAPVIAQTIITPYEIIKWAVGLCGVIGVEFTMFVFMFISMDGADKIGRAIRWFVIGAAFAVAMIANISSTVAAMQVSNDVVELVAAVILGAFAPAANLSAGEVLRRVLEQVNLDKESAVKEHDKALIEEDKRLRNLYISYLKKYGIVDPTEIMRLSSGEEYQSGNDDTSSIRYPGNADSSSNPVVDQVPDRPEQPPLSGRALEIYNDIIFNSRQNWTQQALVQEYKTSPNTIARIRRLLK